jgi:hypothetical protein
MKLSEIHNAGGFRFPLNTPEDLAVLGDDRSYSEKDNLVNGTLDYVDRDDTSMWQTFYPLDEQGPALTLRERIAANKGTVAILDFGGGTGNQMASLLDENRPMHDAVDLEVIKATVMNDEDYSKLAERWKTRAAILAGVVEYNVPEYHYDLYRELTIPKLPEAVFDIVFSFDSLVQTGNPSGIALPLFKSLKKGGVLYVNAAEVQDEELAAVCAVVTDTAGGEATRYAHQTSPRFWPAGIGAPVSYKFTSAGTKQAR